MQDSLREFLNFIKQFSRLAQRHIDLLWVYDLWMFEVQVIPKLDIQTYNKDSLLSGLKMVVILL